MESLLCIYVQQKINQYLLYTIFPCEYFCFSLYQNLWFSIRTFRTKWHRPLKVGYDYLYQ